MLEAQSGEPKLFIAFSLQLGILNLKLDLGFQGLDIHEQNALNPAVALELSDGGLTLLTRGLHV